MASDRTTLPRRTAAWLRDGLRLFRKLPESVTDIEDTPSTSRSTGFETDARSLHDEMLQNAPAYRDSLIDLPSVPRSRRILLSRALYEGDGRVKDIVRKTAHQILRRGWSYAVGETVPEAKANQIMGAMDELNARMNLFSGMRGWLKQGLVDGDLFLQIVTGPGGLQRVQWLDPLPMQRNSNRHDLFPNVDRAYIEYRDGTLVEDDAALTIMRHGRRTPVRGERSEYMANAYDALEIVHGRVDRLPSRRYGRALLEAGYDNARYARAGEANLAWRRKERASPETAWVIGDQASGTPPSRLMDDLADDLEARRRRNINGLKRDMLVEYPIRPEHVAGDASIDRVADIVHQVDTLYASGPVPKQASGYMDNINRDVIPAVEKVLRDNIEAEREWLAEDVMVPLMERMLLMEGIPVEPGWIVVDYAPDEYSLADLATVAEVLERLGKVGLATKASSGRLLERMLPDVYTADEYLVEMAEDRERSQDTAEPQQVGDADDNIE